MKSLVKSLRIVLVAAIAFAVVLAVPAFADDNEITCPENSIVRLYETATGMGSQTGTPTPEHPIEPVFYTQGDMVLRAVGDYKDSYDATTGKITRRVGVKVLDGTEDWSRYTGWSDNSFYLRNFLASMSGGLCTHYVYNPTWGAAVNNTIFINSEWLIITDRRFSTTPAWKQFLADQARAGTPVVVYYPLAEETTEDWTGEHGTSYCADAIKIATKDYVTSSANADHGFGPLNTLLNTVITTINTLVVNTVNQAATIKDIATTRQTRPEVGCPAGKECLLIKNPDGTNNWFEIFDPFYEFFDPIKLTATVGGAEYTYYGTSTGAFGQYTGDSNNLLRWHGNPNWREKYVDGSRSVYNRQWTTATPARTVGGMYETLQDGDETNAGTWAVEYDGTELNGMKAGVVYGIAKCTPQNASRGYTSATPSSTYDELTPEQKTLWNSVPAKTWTEANAAGETHEDTWSHAPASDAATNFRNCWCKMTGLGEPGENGASDGVVYPVGGAAWVFGNALSSAASCASNCAYDCAHIVRHHAGFRAAVFNF